MLKNYLKIAYRNLRRRPSYAAINVLGLAIGIAFCMLIFLFIRSELSFDRFHENADRIFRLHRVPTAPNPIFKADVAMPMPLGPALRETFPGVEHFVRFASASAVVRHQGAVFTESSVVFADSSFFQVFAFPLKKGSPEAALRDPNAVVLTESTARKYFGEKNPLGEQLSIRLFGEYYSFRVTGVVEELPDNSSIHFNILLPFEAMFRVAPERRERATQWMSSSVLTFVALESGQAAESIEAQMPAFLQTHMAELVEVGFAQGFLKEKKLPFTYRLQPLTDIHLNTKVPAGLTAPSNPAYAYILAAIALAVLLMACINFMALAVGLSASRAKEVGVRKVVGAKRRQLMGQFWSEALLLSFAALFGGLLVANLFLPVFNELTGKALQFDFGQNVSLWLVLVGLLGLTGLVAGSYPAFALSGFGPVEALKGKAKLGGANTFTRGLLVVQFTLSIFLIIGTLVMANQLDYMKTKTLGFDGEHVVVIPTQGLEGARVLDHYRALTASEPGIAGVAGADAMPGRGFSRKGFQHDGEIKEVATFRVTPNYLEVLRMNLLSGRDFSTEYAADSTNSIIINEAFARELGLEDPVGSEFHLDWGTLETPTVIGVVQDFHFYTLKAAVEPAVLYTNATDPVSNVYVRIRPGVPAAIDRLRAEWEVLTGEVPFQYDFLDERMDRLYQSEERWGKIVGYGSLFAIFIACMGLFGLAALAAGRRTKEIGIRKVLGASVPGVVALLSKDFLKLVGVAFIIAAPVAYFAMQKWLEDFAYRIELGIGTFILAGLLAALIALATVSYQAIRAALADPVKALRSE